MKRWPITEKPCEKLLSCGAARLSDAELLAVFIRHGHKQQGVMSISRNLLVEFKNLRGVVSANKQEFCAVPGVGEIRFAQLQAAVEIVKRQYEDAIKERPVFENVSDVERYLSCHLRDKEHEVFGLLMLNSQHQLLAFRCLFRGTINAAAVYPREVVKSVLNDNAAAVILVHNHPSGIAEPSHADIRLTADIKSALALIDVDVLDHFVVGDKKIVSLAQRGQL